MDTEFSEEPYEGSYRFRIAMLVTMLAVGCVLSAGFIYLMLAARHWEHSAAHGLFLGFIGLVQIGWGIAFVRPRSSPRYRSGIVLTGGLLTLWLLTLMFPAPFASEAEGTGILEIASVMLEGLAVVALSVLVVGGSASSKPRPVWQLVGVPLAIAIAAGGLLYGAAVPAESATGHDHDGATTASSKPSGAEKAVDPDRIELVVAGIPQPLVAGSEIPIIGDVIGRVTIDRGTSDERYSRTLDLSLFRRSTSEQPIDNAAIQLTARMRYMDHGTFREVAIPSGGGHYVLPLGFPMPGAWELELEVTVPGLSPQTLQLAIDLLD